jgi:hypothetical protein
VNGGQSGSAQLLCAVALLAATAAALLGAAVLDERASTAAAGEADPAALAKLSVELTPQVAERVERIRGLRFERVPTPRVVDSEFFSDLSERELRRVEGDPEQALAADQAVARIVGLLAADEDLEGIVEESGDLAAAAWDTRRGRLYVIDDAVPASPVLVELVLAHELTHAIEDQRFGLPELARADDDRALARLALIEGTATALMAEYGRLHLDQLALGLAALGLDDDTGEIPDFVIEQLEWAYLGGSRFVEELRRLGAGWDLVDHALEHRPPASTEQVLHPLKYLRDERPLTARIDGSVLRRRGWQRADQASLGELGTRQLLALGNSSSVARRAAAGWGGDRYELWRRDSSPSECDHPCRADSALVLRWRWDSAADAEESAAAARRYIERGLGGESSGAGVWTLEGGSVALATSPASTALAFAPSERLATAVADGSGQ